MWQGATEVDHMDGLSFHADASKLLCDPVNDSL